MAMFFYIYPDVGASFALIAYVVVALGGFGSVFGAFAGGIIVGLVEATTDRTVPPMAIDRTLLRQAILNLVKNGLEALGRGGHPDYYRLYKAGGAMDEAVAAARTFLTNNGVRIDEASVQSLTADIFNETGLAGSREAFAQAFMAMARED